MENPWKYPALGLVAVFAAILSSKLPEYSWLFASGFSCLSLVCFAIFARKCLNEENTGTEPSLEERIRRRQEAARRFHEQRNTELYQSGIAAYKRNLPRIILEGKRHWFVAFLGDELISESPSRRKFQKEIRRKGLEGNRDVFSVYVSNDDIEEAVRSASTQQVMQ